MKYSSVFSVLTSLYPNDSRELEDLTEGEQEYETNKKAWLW